MIHYSYENNVDKNDLNITNLTQQQIIPNMETKQIKGLKNY